MMGNRGILHDDAKRIIRPWQVKRWIACVTEFRGRRRAVMQPHRYTELFFLDEAASFAAGHRPCAECRNADYKLFLSLWKNVHGGPAGADLMDERLHSERLEGKRKRTYRADLASLPDGAYFVEDGRAWLVWGDSSYAWTDSGYEKRSTRRPRQVEVLTPRSTVAVLAAGYVTAIHPSAQHLGIRPAPWN